MSDEPINLSCYKYKRCWRIQTDCLWNPEIPDGNDLNNYKFEIFIETILVDASTNQIIKSERDLTPEEIKYTELETLKPGLLQQLLEVVGQVIYLEST
jgi:hypothetical protein